MNRDRMDVVLAEWLNEGPAAGPRTRWNARLRRRGGWISAQVGPSLGDGCRGR